MDETLFNVERHNRSVNAPVILYLGRLTRIKRLDIVLDILAKPSIRELGARLVVAGSPDRSLNFSPIAFARERGLLEHIDFVGTVARDMRRKLLACASVFVLPSEGESFGLAVAEAMSAGVPVVTTTNVGIAAEAEEAGALRVAPLSSDSFAKVVGEVLRDTKRSDLGARGREYAKAHFTWTHAARATLAAYSRVLGEVGSGS